MLILLKYISELSVHKYFQVLNLPSWGALSLRPKIYILNELVTGQSNSWRRRRKLCSFLRNYGRVILWITSEVLAIRRRSPTDNVTTLLLMSLPAAQGLKDTRRNASTGGRVRCLQRYQYIFSQKNNREVSTWVLSSNIL